jgi:glycine/D-amino acid oxidase-like deaminating enzyme
VTFAEVDYLVVGGGITGCSLAMWLARERAGSVLLLERGELNAGASGGNAGSLHLQMLPHYAKLTQPHEMEDAERPVALHRDGIETWRQLQRDLPDFQMRSDGGWMVAETADELAFLEAKAARERRCGLRVDTMGETDLRSRARYLGPSVRGANWCPDEGKLNPLLATIAIAREARRLGARIETEAPVTALARESGRFTAHTLRGKVRARCVIDAAGPWSSQVAAMLGVHFPFGTRPMQMCVTDAAPPVVPHLVQHASQALTLKQAATGQVLIGGGWPAKEDGDGRTKNLRESVQGNLALACRIVPALAHRVLLRAWAAMNNRVPDGNPVLGEVAQVPGFFMAVPVPNGYTLGPECARLVAGVATGRARPDAIAKAWSPDRFLSLKA